MIKLGLLGASHIHTPGFSDRLKERSDVDVVAVWDPDTAIAKKYANKLECSVAANTSSLLSIASLNAVVILSQTNLHEMLVQEAVGANKHCFVEKPLGLGLHDAFQIREAVIDAGANTVNIADTVGYTIPSEFAQRIEDIKKNVPNIDKAVISVHCHNDLGLSVSNSLAAVRAGVRQVEGCINGLGERAGNAALEEIIMAIETRDDLFDVTTNIDTTQIYRTSRLVSDITGFPVQPNKAIVGANAFRHASGIHQDGVIKDKSTYEIIDPRSVGWPSNSLVLGKLSGRAGLRSRLEELGYQLEQEELNEVFEAFKNLADRKREVTDQDLESLMSSRRRIADVPTIYELDHVQVSTGDHEVPTATVKLIDPDGQTIVDAATGTGPVDAVYRAINRVIGVDNKLTEFRVDAVTEGIDALGDVTIRIESDGDAFVGRGSDTDIIVASAKAYMNALNRAMAVQDSQ